MKHSELFTVHQVYPKTYRIWVREGREDEVHQEGEEDPVLEGRPGAEAGRLGVAGHLG